jgi:hypothetical protein
MAKLHDPVVSACYLNALSNWRYEGYVVFTERAAEWLRLNLPRCSLKHFAEMLHQFVAEGAGEIDQVLETRPEWSCHHEFHYDLRPVIEGRRLYVETRLIYTDADDPDDPLIHIVNIHLA